MQPKQHRWDLLDTSMGIMNLRCCCCCCFLIKLSSSKTCELFYRQAGRRRLLMTFEIVVVLECNCETGRGARVRQKQHTVTTATAEPRQKAEGHVPTSHLRHLPRHRGWFLWWVHCRCKGPSPADPGSVFPVKSGRGSAVRGTDRPASWLSLTRGKASET